MALKFDRKSHESGVEILTLTGSLTLGRESQYLEETVCDLIGTGGSRVILDMTEVSFADSAGIGILVGCHGKASKAGSRFRLAAVGARVLNVLRITKVDSLLRIDANVADSVQAIGETA